MKKFSTAVFLTALTAVYFSGCADNEPAETITEQVTSASAVIESAESTESAGMMETSAETASEITSETTAGTVTQTSAAETSAQTTLETTAAETEPVITLVMEQYMEKSTELEELFAEISQIKTMPAVHITTYNKEAILSKEIYNDSVIDVFNCGEEYRLTAEGGVKVRGNSTADQGDEKPYRIKFTERQNMLGLHDGAAYKSWVLLRSQWNLVPDYTAFSLAKVIFDGKYYCSDCTYVNLYINGEYRGLYLLCEQNQAAEGRIDVYEPKKDETQTDIGYLIEMDNYAGEEHPYFTLDYNETEFTDYVGTTNVFPADDYSIKSDTNTDEQREFIAKYTEGVYNIMYEAVENNKLLMFDEGYELVSAEGVYSTAKEAVGAVIDLDSLVNMMILEELVHNYDVGAGSFYMAVDFSKDSIYKKMTFLAPWDFNWAYSEETHGRYYAGAFQEPVHDGVDRTNVWLTVIMKADWFREMLMDKWAELGSGAKLRDVVEDVCITAEALAADLSEDDMWRMDSGIGIAYFVDGRIDWLCEQWNR